MSELHVFERRWPLKVVHDMDCVVCNYRPFIEALRSVILNVCESCFKEGVGNND